MADERAPSKLLTHLKVFLYAVIFGMIAFGFVRLGMLVQRWLQG